MMTLLIFIITLGILVFVHELGHFFVARRNGIRADEFGFGFPPRIMGFYRDKNTKKIKFIFGKRKEHIDTTIYSINWIPLGGFVKIMGEDGGDKDTPDSFASKSPWVRIKVLGAGVTMNFILAWAVIALALMVGAPQPVDEIDSYVGDSKIQIAQVGKGSPAETMGLQVGDEVLRCTNLADKDCRSSFKTYQQVKEFIARYKGEKITLKVKRGTQFLDLSGEPRVEYPSDQGPLGISLVQTAIVKHSWYVAVYKGLFFTFDLTWSVLVAFYDAIRNLVVGNKVAVDVAGPVGIVYLTKQVSDLGFVYILQFVAMLSVNLGVINALPIPALDGGRILFILIEKFKGRPVNEKLERVMHTVGFALLITLMVFVTFRDFLKFDILDKVKNLF